MDSARFEALKKDREETMNAIRNSEFKLGMKVEIPNYGKGVIVSEEVLEEYGNIVHTGRFVIDIYEKYHACLWDIACAYPIELIKVEE